MGLRATLTETHGALPAAVHSCLIVDVFKDSRLVYVPLAGGLDPGAV